MARSKKTTLEDLDFPEPSQEDFDLEEFLGEVGPGTSVIDIFRIKTDGSRPRVARVTLDVLREDVYGYLAESFGTGKYDLQFKGADKRIKACKRLAVEAPGTVPNNGIHHSNGNGNTQPNSFERELLLSMIAAQKPIDIGSLLQGLAAMKPAAPPPPPDPTMMFTAILTAVTGIKPADDSLDKMQKMAAFMKDLMPEGRTEENLYTVAKDVGTKLIEAIKKYRRHCELNKTETKYIKHFSTFVSTWRDWLESDVGTTSIKEVDIVSQIQAKMDAYKKDREESL